MGSIRWSFVSSAPWRVFLNRGPAARKRCGRRRQGVAPGPVNCSHGSGVALLLPLGLPFPAVAGTPGDAAIPKAEASGEDFSAPPRKRPVSALPYRSALPVRPRGSHGTTWDFHRSVLSAIVCGRPRQSSRRTARRNRVSTREESFPRLLQEPELGLPPAPKRDASRTILTWPLRRRLLPDDPGS